MVDPTGHTRGFDFIFIFARRLARLTRMTDWIVGDDYSLVDYEGTIIGENEEKSMEFVQEFANWHSDNVPSDGEWHEIKVYRIADIRTHYVDGWAIRSDDILGDGGFWLNGSHEIEVLGGQIKACKPSPGDWKVKVGDFSIDYVWHDNIDANSFWEQRERIITALQQGNWRTLGVFLLEADWDVVLDKVADLNYDVSIHFSHKRDQEPGQPRPDPPGTNTTDPIWPWSPF